jgi:hypothetical protein
MRIVGQGRCEDVLTYPPHVASVYRFCSSVPEFIVSLPSLHGSLQTSLRLTNRLHQLACKGLTPSGIVWFLSIPCTHAGRTQHVCYIAASFATCSAILFCLPDLRFVLLTMAATQHTSALCTMPRGQSSGHRALAHLLATLQRDTKASSQPFRPRQKRNW